MLAMCSSMTAVPSRTFTTLRKMFARRDADGTTTNGTTPLENISNPSRDAFVWPKEIQHSDFFRRRQPGLAAPHFLKQQSPTPQFPRDRGTCSAPKSAVEFHSHCGKLQPTPPPPRFA